MTTTKQLSALALALPDVEEKDHFGSPSFRRNDRIFAQTSTDTNEAILKLGPVHQEFLFEARANTFKPEVWGSIRWTRVTLDGVEMLELRLLVQEAYEQVAKSAKSRYAKGR